MQALRICCQKNGNARLLIVVKRDAVAHLQVFHGMSERRACQVLGADRTTIRYCSRRTDDEDLREKLRIAGGYATQTHMDNNNAEALIKTG